MQEKVELQLESKCEHKYTVHACCDVSERGPCSVYIERNREESHTGYNEDDKRSNKGNNLLTGI